MTVRILLFLALAGVCLMGAPALIPPDAIVEKYCAATRSQAELMKGARMDVEMDADLPKLKKQGKLHALRKISALGRITYEALKFEGDGTVKNHVIARYLTAEAEAQKSDDGSMAVTPQNYKFKYKGQGTLNDRDVHFFEVTPRKKRPGLFKGEIWIDAETFLRVRETGALVKNPSIFLKKVRFTRSYEIRDGISVPLQVESIVETRLVGKARLTIDYSNFSIEAPPQTRVADLGGQ